MRNGHRKDCETRGNTRAYVIGTIATHIIAHAGSPITMPWVNDVATIVEGWYPGGEDGETTAALLFGDSYPSGKLPITFPVAMSDRLSNTPERYPGVDGKVYYDEDLQVGYRWFQSQNIEPLFAFAFAFAFAFGLSYTSFSIGDLVLSQSVIVPGNSLSLQVNVSNTGDKPGAEVIQACVAYPAQLGEPPKQLRAFRKVTLQPAESKTVELALNPRSLAVWDTTSHDWVVHPGSYKIFVGNSSVDTPLEETVIVQ